MYYEFGITTLTDSSIASVLVSVVLLSGSITLYFSWFQLRTKRVLLVLRQLAAALTMPEDDWHAAKVRAAMVVKTHSWALAAWRATEPRVIALPQESDSRTVMLVSPRDIWVPQHLLVRQLNLPLAQVIPVLILCIGLLFTLIFVAIRSPYTDPVGIEFIPVIIALGASVVWTIAVLHHMGELQISTENILDALWNLAPSVGGEIAAISHLQMSFEQKRHIHEQQDITEKLLNETRSSLKLMEAQLTESMRFSDVLQRIETDLAPSLAGAVSESVLPPFELITQRFVTSIDGFREKLLEIHHDSLKSILSDFSTLLKQATEAEVAHLRVTLEGFSSRLDTAGLTIGYETADAAKVIDKAGKLLTNRVEKAATDLTSASDAVSLSVKEIEATIMETAKLGQRGNESFADGLELADVALVQLKEVIDKLGDTASTMQRVSGGVGHALAALQMKIAGSARRS